MADFDRMREILLGVDTIGPADEVRLYDRSGVERFRSKIATRKIEGGVAYLVATSLPEESFLPGRFEIVNSKSGFVYAINSLESPFVSPGCVIDFQVNKIP